MVLNRQTNSLASSLLSRSMNGGRQNEQAVTLSGANGKSVVKRRGFGLFSDDEDDGEEAEAESSRLSVSFSGNKSGFEVLEKVKGKGRMSTDGTGMFGFFHVAAIHVPLFVSTIIGRAAME